MSNTYGDLPASIEGSIQVIRIVVHTLPHLHSTNSQTIITYCTVY